MSEYGFPKGDPRWQKAIDTHIRAKPEMDRALSTIKGAITLEPELARVPGIDNVFRFYQNWIDEYDSRLAFRREMLNA